MRKFKAAKLPSIAFFLALAVITHAGTPPDRSGLLALVPPDAQIVAGMNSRPAAQQSRNFLLITRNNVADLDDFFALSGADSSRVIEQVVLIADGGISGAPSEHSLLVKGRFDKNHIYRSVSNSGGAAIDQYRGIQVLLVQPLDRDRNVSRSQRWLVILDSDTLILGTISSVQREIDRWLAHSTIDPSLAKRFARMRSGQQTWCILNAPAGNPEIKNALTALDPKFSELTDGGDSFQFGIRYGKHIEFEYAIAAATGSSARNISNALALSIGGVPMAQSSLLTSQDSSESVLIERRFLKIPRAKYARWLDEVAARMRARMTTP